MGKLQSAYVAVFDRGFGKEAIWIPLDYDFHGSGVMPNPELEVHVDNPMGGYLNLTTKLVENQSDAGFIYKVAQQTVSEWIANHRRVQKGIMKYGSSRRMLRAVHKMKGLI